MNKIFEGESQQTPKRNARDKIPASSFFFIQLEIALESLTRMRDVLTWGHMAWCKGGWREVFAVRNQLRYCV